MSLNGGNPTEWSYSLLVQQTTPGVDDELRLMAANAPTV